MIKYAQDFLNESCGGECFGSFNARVMGDSWAKAVSGSPQGPIWAARNAGWNLADSMIKSGEIYSKTIIKGKEITFKCFKDGDSYCCVGEGFENLQESNNYAFGECFDSAIINFSFME